MPKVGKIDLAAGKRRKTFEIYYSRKDNFYLKEYPQEWINVVNSFDEKTVENYKRKSSDNHLTEGTLISDAQYVMRRYYEITAETKRVIMIKQGYGTSLRSKRIDSGSWQGHNENVGRVPRFAEDLKLDWSVGFDWKIADFSYGTRPMYYEIFLNDDYTVKSTVCAFRILLHRLIVQLTSWRL